jgi:WXG100 family type VII secretion target
LAEQTQNDAATMAQTANKFRSTNSDLSGMLSRLMNELESLRAGWRGQGAQAFDNARLRWAEDMNQLDGERDREGGALLHLVGLRIGQPSERLPGRLRHQTAALGRGGFKQ